MTYIPVTEAESTALLMLAGPAGQYVPLTFGSGGVALDTEDAQTTWAVETLNTMRAKQRDLAEELNRTVETAVTVAASEALLEAEFECLGTAEATGRATDLLTEKITTRVFEALQAAGFTVVRKGA